jgi:hypothetical protein
MSFNLENYEDVDTRLHRFYELHQNGRIETELIRERENAEGRLTQVIIVARVFIDAGDDKPKAIGHAEEILGSTPVNRTSMVENCETSAIGRALANAGFSAKGQRASRQEMEKVERLSTPQDYTAPKYGASEIRNNIAEPMTEKQFGLIKKLLGGKLHIVDDYKKEHGITGNFTKKDATVFIDWLKENPQDDPWAADIAKGGSDE